jgi:hypothetical protein
MNAMGAHADFMGRNAFENIEERRQLGVMSEVQGKFVLN